MILVSILAVLFALTIDLVLGDPKNKFHPTVWIGTLIGKITPIFKNDNPKIEKLCGLIITISIVTLVLVLLHAVTLGLDYLNLVSLNKLVALLVSVLVIGILLKTTIAIKGMENHTNLIIKSLVKNDLDSARTNLSMIVKRDTKTLDKQHIISATLESISENTVDGIIGPLFYFAIFGLAGAFAYRTVNTIDSMIGYKTYLFRNLGWFGANCDKILNFLPSRLTGLMMIMSVMILRADWKHSFVIMCKDGKRTESPNAGYPMAAMAGALGVKFEKINHYTLGDGNSELSEKHFKSAISIMKLTTILFSALFTIPLIVILSYVTWWLHV